MKLDDVEAAALKLTATDRLTLVRCLLASLEENEDAAEDVDAAWIEEAKRRLHEIQAGTVTPISGQEALTRIRLALG